MALDAVAQDRFKVRLHEGDGGRPAKRVGRWQRIENLDQLIVDADIIGSIVYADALGDLVRKTAGLPAAHDFVIDGDGARLVVNLRIAVRDGHGESGAAEQVCHGGADRTVAGNHEIELLHWEHCFR